MTDPKDRLLQAYNHMLDELHAAMEKTEEQLSPTVDEMLANAEQMSKKLYALTQDEAKTVVEHLKRDIGHARKYMQTEGKELNQWLKFDIDLVEGRFADFLNQAADKNWLDFRAFKDFQTNTLYKTGEICGPGTLRCLNCGQEMRMTSNNHIPPCPKCHHTEFERVVD